MTAREVAQPQAHKRRIRQKQAHLLLTKGTEVKVSNVVNIDISFE